MKLNVALILQVSRDIIFNKRLKLNLLTRSHFAHVGLIQKFLLRIWLVWWCKAKTISCSSHNLRLILWNWRTNCLYERNTQRRVLEELSKNSWSKLVFTKHCVYGAHVTIYSMKIKDTHILVIITSTIFISHRSLNEQEAQLMNELDDFYDIVTLSRDRQKLERTIFRLERAHDFAEQLLSSNTSPIAQIVNR